MKFSESWLREWVNPTITIDELMAQLTMAGLEVDGVESAAGAFSGVVVGEIIEVAPHPDAEKLQVCQVSAENGEVFNVVCGAPNARAGIKVPFAMIGAVLPGNFKIKKAKLRGVESFGMLCAQTELEAGEDSDGLWELPLDAPVGQDLREYLSLNDSVIEVDLTPNRSDCLSMIGLAREVGVLNRTEVTQPEFDVATESSELRFPAKLTANDACPRYLGRVIEGVNVQAATPLWMQEKLRRSDVRSIDPIVDVTNYVMLELGQPMHAFDLAKLQGGIDVKFAQAGDKLQLLNDQEVELKEGTLTISDSSGPLALAGVMGGASSAVSETTHNIFLEAAFFDPIVIAGKARDYGLHTDSSHRFERGVDYDITERAMERATQLILDIAGGKAGPITRAESESTLPSARTVTLRKARISSLLGLALADEDVLDIHARLGLKLLSSNDEGWTFEVPSYRFDIAIEADLLEELARIYGYDKFPTRATLIPQALPTKSEADVPEDRVIAQLIARGYNEVITYSFIDPSMHKALFGEEAAVSLLNPISADLSTMRTSIVPGLIHTLISNVKRQQDRVSIFESGLRFQPKGDELVQTQGLAGLIYGARDEQSWCAQKGDVDFYDIKGDLESVLCVTGFDVRFESGVDLRYLHPGQSAYVVHNGESIGYIGTLHPELIKGQGLSKPAYVFEIDFEAISQGMPPSYKDISKYPEVERDLAFVCDQATEVQSLMQAIYNSAGENMKQLKVFDIYSGEGIDSQRKSVAFNLTFQHSSRTLNEEEVNLAVEAVVEKLKGDFNAVLR